MSRSEASVVHANDVVRLLEQEDARLGSYMRWAQFALLLLVLGVGGWAAVTSISGAVIATAKVAVEANLKSVQHLEGGIVRRIAVRDGQRVTQGDLLVTLDAGEIDERIKGLQSQKDAKKEQLALMRKEMEDLKALADKRLVPRTQLVTARRQVAELEGEYGRLVSELSRFATNRTRLDVVAPIDGHVHRLAVHTVGGVIKPGEEILQIVPSNARLILEARVDPRDIDQVRAGQLVSLRLSSFNQRTTPELAGKVVNVSADLVSTSNRDDHYYLVRISLDEGETRRLGGKPLVPGMPAEVFIQTDRRSVISYLMKPLADQLHRAMREE